MSSYWYYVVPMDVIPEQVYGPPEYVDDIYLSVYVLKLVADECRYNLLKAYSSIVALSKNDSNLKYML